MAIEGYGDVETTRSGGSGLRGGRGRQLRFRPQGGGGPFRPGLRSHGGRAVLPRVPQAGAGQRPLQAILEVLRSAEFRSWAATVPGYAADEAGQIISMRRTLPWYKRRSAGDAPDQESSGWTRRILGVAFAWGAAAARRWARSWSACRCGEDGSNPAAHWPPYLDGDVDAAVEEGRGVEERDVVLRLQGSTWRRTDIPERVPRTGQAFVHQTRRIADLGQQEGEPDAGAFAQFVQIHVAAPGAATEGR